MCELVPFLFFICQSGRGTGLEKEEEEEQEEEGVLKCFSARRPQVVIFVLGGACGFACECECKV